MAAEGPALAPTFQAGRPKEVAVICVRRADCPRNSQEIPAPTHTHTHCILSLERHCTSLRPSEGRTVLVSHSGGTAAPNGPGLWRGGVHTREGGCGLHAWAPHWAPHWAPGGQTFLTASPRTAVPGAPGGEGNGRAVPQPSSAPPGPSRRTDPPRGAAAVSVPLGETLPPLFAPRLPGMRSQSKPGVPDPQPPEMYRRA